MPAFQLLTALINLGGQRDNVVAKVEGEAITLPEVIVLQALHGGEEHVHGLVAVGHVERTMTEEFERLLNLYGSDVEKIFPRVAGMVNLPLENAAIPSNEEVTASRAAAENAAAKVRAKKAAKPAAPAEPAAAPAEPVIPAELTGGMPDLLATPT